RPGRHWRRSLQRVLKGFRGTNQRLERRSSILRPERPGLRKARPTDNGNSAGRSLIMRPPNPVLEESGMDFLEHLRAHKQPGANELAARLAEEQKQKEDEAARSRAAEEQQRSQESERDKHQAEELFARLPELVLEAAKQGQHSAV